MKFFALVFLTIAFCLSVNAKRVLNKRYYQNTCYNTLSEVDFRLHKFYKKLEDLTHDKKNHDFDHTHDDAIKHLYNQAYETAAYITDFQTKCQQSPSDAGLLREAKRHCNEIKIYKSLIDQKIPNLKYYNSGINTATDIVTAKCDTL